MKNGLWIASFLLLGILLSDFCHKQTKGFSESKITQAFPSESDPNNSLSSENASILNQPFYYLKKGHSAYAFISEDQKYIIKFLRDPNISPPFWTTLKPVRWILPTYCNSRIKKKGTEKELLLNSYKLANKYFKEQSGILYSHLNTTSDLQKKITFYDNIKVKHTISTDTTAFILQKKATPFAPHFIKLLNEHKKEEIESLLTEFASLLRERALKGIYDKDLSPNYNLGIFENHFLTFDLDGLRNCNIPSDPETLQKNMVKEGMKMILWLESLHSDLSIFLEREIYKFSLLS